MPVKRRALAERRKAVGSTQEQLAEVLGVERSTVVRWEAGETTPLPGSRPKLAQALAVSVDELDAMLAEGQTANCLMWMRLLSCPTILSTTQYSDPRGLIEVPSGRQSC